MSSGSSTPNAAGLTHAIVGTAAAGASFDNPGTASKWYYKQITLSKNSLLTAVLAQVKGNATNGVGLTAGVWTDNAGAVGNFIAMSNQSTRNSGNGNLDQGMLMSATTRQVALPVGKWLVAGTYWIGVWLGCTVTNAIVIAYNSGTGTDKTYASTNQDFFLDGLTTASTSNDFSIAADLVS